jgi:signal transduction histidine kinase
MSDLEEVRQELRVLRRRAAELEQTLTSHGEFLLDQEPLATTYAALCRNMNVFTFVYSLDHRFAFCSHTADGYISSDVLGSTPYDFMEPEEAARLREAFRRVVQDGVAVDFTGTDTRFGRTYMSHLFPLRFNDRVVAIGNICEEVTERIATQRHLADSAARLRFLVQSLPIVSWAVDRDLCFSSSIGAGLAGLELQQNQVVGQPLVQFLGESDQTRVAIEAHRHALTGKTSEYSIVWGNRHYHSLVSPWRDDLGQIIGAVGVAIDLTERARLEAQSQAARDELEKRVAQRTHQLKEAYDNASQQKLVLRRMVELLERDKRMMAFDIHDGLVQDMVAAQLFFGAAEPELEQARPHAVESFRQGLELLQKTIREARRIMGGFSPYELEKFGLIPAVEALAAEIQERTGIPVRFSHRTKQERFAPAVDLAIFRIVQESLNNIWKHSQSARAEVRIEQQGEQLQITVRDWGCGFDPLAISPKKFGVLSIRERAQLLGGEAKINSTIGAGTIIEVRLPTTDSIFQTGPAEPN